MLPTSEAVRGRFEIGARAALVAVAVWCVGAPSPARGQDLEARQELRRSLREYLFLNGQLGFRQRAAVYAEDAVEGPSGRSELRFHLNGRYASSPSGGLGAYVGLGVIGRFGGNGGVADPLLSPYDEFEAQQNIRLFGAHLSYALRDDEGRPMVTVKAGRLSDFDDRARLLLYDGLEAELRLGRAWILGAYGGRRAVLDGNFSDDRSDAAAQLVSGVYARARFGTVGVRVSHRFEEVQQAGLRLTWDPVTELGLALSGQLVFGGDAAIEADRSITGLETSDLPFAVIVRLDGDYSSPSGRTGLYLASELQLGVDPRVYGRAGRGPGDEDIDAALRTTLNQARLDRLFFGPGQPHVLAELGFEHWLASVFGIRAGGFLRYPIGDAALRSLQPRVIEGWLGPEIATSRGDRIAVEVRVAAEDPGDPGRIFGAQGDGERLYGSLRAFGEVPFRLSDGWALSLRPEVEGTVWNTEGPLSETTNQLGFYGGLVTALRAGPRFRAAVRYGAGLQPDFVAAGVQVVHDLQVWVGGAF